MSRMITGVLGWTLIFGLYFGLLFGCDLNSQSKAVPDDVSNQPVVSPMDDRSYRALTLDNGLQVLLISDPATQKAAAALDVYVGSGDNPEGRGGLAHFLEHMLFLGTEKYPDPAEYEQYITEHGGNRNAYTSFDHTNYFFDINADYLPEALDRFAQFFVAPNLDAEYVDREMNAVQAEYQMGLNNDGRRGLDVLQALMNPEHPYSQFSVGSLESLADRPEAPIRAELIEFYERYYKAGNMRLVVLGKESLDSLEATTLASFSEVPAGQVEHDILDMPIFPADRLPAKVYIEPTAANRSVELVFPIADYRSDYRTNPGRYLGHLVGHEGPTSLLAQLKREGLAESLSAGTGLGWRGGALFYIDIALTEAGVAAYPRVVQMTHTALQKIREQGPQSWVFDELKRLSDLDFRFQEKGEPIRYVSRLADAMHTYEVTDWLRGGLYLEDYRAEVIADALAALNPDNALVTVSYPGIATAALSPNYQTPYAVKSADSVATVLSSEDPAALALDLPAPNRFIADVVDVIEGDDSEDRPERLASDDVTLWYLHDDTFNVPKGALNINFRSHLVVQSVTQDVALELYTALVNDKANDFAYAAQLAGLNSSIYTHQRGLSMRVNGYDDKQVILLKELITVAQAMDFSADRFNNLRAERVRRIQNKSAERPASQVMGALREATNHSAWSDEQRLAVLTSITLEETLALAKAFWRSVQIEALLYGNYAPEDAQPVIAALQPLVASEQENLPALKVTRLPTAHQQLTDVLDHNDSVVSWYIQGGSRNYEDRALYALTAQAMKSGFFQQLRTEQQLGYIASAFSWAQNEVPGVVMIIQSPSHSSKAVYDAMATFVTEVPRTIDAAAFERHRAALVAEITEPHKNLWERAEFFWSSMGQGDYSFESRDKLAAAVEAIPYEFWLEFFRTEFIDSPRSLLVVAPGQFADSVSEPKMYDSAQQVKDGNDIFSITLAE